MTRVELGAPASRSPANETIPLPDAIWSHLRGPRDGTFHTLRFGGVELYCAPDGARRSESHVGHWRQTLKVSWLNLASSSENSARVPKRAMPFELYNAYG